MDVSHFLNISQYHKIKTRNPFNIPWARVHTTAQTKFINELITNIYILQGLLIIFCFIIKVENYSISETTSSSSKSSIKNSLDDFCTTQINNPLNCKYEKKYGKSFFYPLLCSTAGNRLWKNFSVFCWFFDFSFNFYFYLIFS